MNIVWIAGLPVILMHIIFNYSVADSCASRIVDHISIFFGIFAVIGHGWNIQSITLTQFLALFLLVNGMCFIGHTLVYVKTKDSLSLNSAKFHSVLGLVLNVGLVIFN